MANLRLHARGVFSNVYRYLTVNLRLFQSLIFRGTILSPGTEQEIAIKKTWPSNELKCLKKFLPQSIFRNSVPKLRATFLIWITQETA